MNVVPIPSRKPRPGAALVAAALAAGIGAGPAALAQSLLVANHVALQDVVVSGTRSERDGDELPISMDVIGARAMKQGQVGDIRNLARGLPNVSVKRAPARLSVTGRGNPVGADGNAGFSIRGQGGNRVSMLVDGIRLPRSYIHGSNAFGRDAVALELVRRVELVRGPSSVLYGSDGLAGLVNFITLEPTDFLRQGNAGPKNIGGKVWVGFNGEDQGVGASATVAAQRGENAQSMLSAMTDGSKALGNMGSNDAADLGRTTPNPQVNRGEALLGKLVLRPGDGQRHALTLEHVRKDGEYQLLSSRAILPLSGTASLIAAAVVDETSAKTMDRSRFTWSADFRLETALADRLQTGLSWQDTPALRIDHYALQVQSQAGYFPSPSAVAGKSLSGFAFSPRSGLLFRPARAWALFGNYASGFRAPEAQQVNNVFEGFNAKLLPNPDLRPETSRNLELGLRARLPRLALDLAAFGARYRNLIVEKKNLGTAQPGVPSADNPTLFQTVNVDRARISSIEFKGVWRWGRVLQGELGSPFAYGRAWGADAGTGRPLGAIDPARRNLGLSYEAASWDLRLDLVHRAAKEPGELESLTAPKSDALQFTPPPATTLDLGGQWRIATDLRLGWSITNLGARKYWNWADVQGLASNVTPLVVDAYTQPGRRLRLSLVKDL